VLSVKNADGSLDPILCNRCGRGHYFDTDRRAKGRRAMIYQCSYCGNEFVPPLQPKAKAAAPVPAQAPESVPVGPGEAPKEPWPPRKTDYVPKKGYEPTEFGNLEIVARLVDKDGKYVEIKGKRLACHANIIMIDPDYNKVDPSNYPEIVGHVTPILVRYPTGKYTFRLVGEYNSPHYGLLRADTPATRTIKKDKKTTIELKFPVPPAGGADGGGGATAYGGKGGEGGKGGDATAFGGRGGDANVNVDVFGEKGRLCPTCGRIFGREMHTLTQLEEGKGTYYCDHCGGEFIETPRGMVPLHPVVNVERAPVELCPDCNHRVKIETFKTPQQGVIYRLKCENPRCHGKAVVNPGGRKIFKPWFMDLSERDYEHWKEVRKVRKLEQLEVLKNLPPLSNPRLQGRREREIKRMEDNIKRHSFTDAYVNRLGISEDALRNSGFDKDEHKMFSDEDLKDFRDGLGKKVKKEDMFLTEEQRAEKASEDLLKSKRFAPSRMINRLYENTQKTAFSIALALVGIVIGALFGMPFLLGFLFWAMRNLLPTPKPLKLVDDWEGNKFGSLFARGEDFNNRYSTGIAATKSLLKILMLISFGYGFFATELPFRGMLLLLFCFTAYFSLPGEFSTEESYKFVEGLFRPIVAIFLAFGVFSAIFQSAELAWLTLAFFAMIPVVTEKKNVARAIGNAGSGIAANYEMFDKIVFVFFMLIGLFYIAFGGGMNLDWGTLAGNVFFPLWIISLIGGITSPSQVRPYTGVLVLLVVFLFYTAGAGDQIVGQGFFGAWWPTVHNTITAITTPMGDMFSTLGNTFGQTFMLLTNPMGFAQQIMEGTYEPNPLGGPTGAFGVEIENLQVPAIYPGTQAMLTLNVKNAGPVKGENVKVGSIPNLSSQRTLNLTLYFHSFSS
jgi:DNA-directed RNA polymerase subunit RPC12/RpoP